MRDSESKVSHEISAVRNSANSEGISSGAELMRVKKVFYDAFVESKEWSIEVILFLMQRKG
jgi:hypothetical protein